MPERPFEFHPPDRRRIWKDLALTMSQASALTGVSERQIQHWMDREYIGLGATEGRKINGDGLERIMLIGQARQAGIPLRRAVRLANEYLRRERAQQLDVEVGTQLLRDLETQLETLRVAVDGAQKLVRDLAPPA